MNKNSISVIMLGATGAVGTQAFKALLNLPEVKHITLLGRRPVPDVVASHVDQYSADIFKVASYEERLPGHEVAICTLGVGQPSKMSREDFIKIDKLAVIDFAKACKSAGVRHFELLSSIGIDSASTSFFLRTKGELVEELEALEFERLSIFQPSMILTPNNRYGFLQGFILLIWPLLKPLFFGKLKKYRGVEVERLGKAFAKNVLQNKSGVEFLDWEAFQQLVDE